MRLTMDTLEAAKQGWPFIPHRAKDITTTGSTREGRIELWLAGERLGSLYVGKRGGKMQTARVIASILNSGAGR